MSIFLSIYVHTRRTPKGSREGGEEGEAYPALFWKSEESALILKKNFTRRTFFPGAFKEMFIKVP